MKMSFKKETKRTCVYETDTPLTAVSQVYVDKAWLSLTPGFKQGVWPPSIELEVKVPA